MSRLLAWTRSGRATTTSLCRGYWFGKYEVTNAQYRQFKPRHDSGQYEGNNVNHNQQPVVNISWDDATTFAKWFSDKTGNISRLPTEIEWEYAARAGTSAVRYFGDNDAQLCRYPTSPTVRPARFPVSRTPTMAATTATKSSLPWAALFPTTSACTT